MIGKTLGHYQITAAVGRGGMGEVYAARDTKLGREVALKFLPADFAQDTERLHRFEREARLLASLNHPNVATIHGLEEAENQRFLVLELVPGDDLAVRIRRGRIATNDALTIARQIAEGMEAAHEKGIIHRDLKPANIKLTPDGAVKILDFGLARASETNATQPDLANSPTITADHTRDGTLLGTAPYMSPEQLKGQTVDARTDIWAFGCVIYEMLTGISPFVAASSAEMMAKTMSQDPDWTQLPRDLPPSVRRLVRRCLAKDPRHRLHAVADIRIVLAEAVEGTNDEVAIPATARSGWSRRITLIAAIAFVLGATATYFLAGKSATQSKATGNVVRLMIPVRDDAAVVPMPESSSVALSPDGTLVVYVAASVKGGVRIGQSEFSNTQLYQRPIDGFKATPIEGTTGGSSPFFSPDSRWIGYFDFRTGALKKIARDGGAPSELCFVHGLSFRGAHWADDGSIYFADMSGIWLVDEAGGEPHQVAVADHSKGEKTYRFPRKLPGTHFLLISRASSEILSYDDADVALLDLQTDEVHPLLRGGLNPRYLPTGHVVFGRGGKVFSVPFDLDRLEVTGGATELFEGVVTSDGYGSMQLSCSNDGTLVYIAGGPNQFATQLLILESDGSVEAIPQPAKPYGNIELGPDANSIVLSVLGANASLWIYELQRGTMTKLVSGWDNYAPAWNHAGDTIAFGSNRDGKEGVWLTAADGSGDPKLLVELEGGVYPSSWSPDDQWLLISSLSPRTGMDVWMADEDGEMTAAIQSPARELAGEFSPDGHFIAYTSDETGQLEVYVQSFPITGRKWKLSEDGGDLPVWSDSGDAVYYWNEQRLMKVNLQIGSEFRPARARQVLEAAVEVHDYDVFPDGERFVVLGRSSSREEAATSVARGIAHGRLFPAQSPDLHVVVNWFEELERLSH